MATLSARIRRSFQTCSPWLRPAVAALAATLPATALAQAGFTRAAAPAMNALLFAPSAATVPANATVSSSLDDAAAAPEPATLAALPEAPLPQFGVNPEPKRGSNPADKIARKNTMTIPADWHAQHLTAKQKAVAGLQDLYGTETVIGWFLSAGYEQLTNGAPNYGTDKGAFGERLGAAAIRGTSQNFFTEVVLAPALHEDARYYVEGPKYNFVHRTVYAVTRTLVTRNDEGRNTINGALLLGYAGSAALTPLYYPSINRNFHDVATVYGGGIGGAALGFFVSEFTGDALRALHLMRQP